MMSGWIKLHRDLSDHWLWECEVFSKGQAWVDLIMFAHFSEEPKKIMIKGKLYTLSRGQQARSELTLSKKWKWSRNKVRRFLKKLENDSMLEQHSDNKTSIITISNFDKYQRREPPNDTPNDTTVDTPPGHHTDTTRDTIEECKNEENGKVKTKEGENPTDKESLPVDQVKKQDPPLSEKTDPPQQGEAKPPAPPKPAKKKKPRFTVDLETLDPIFDREVMEKFIEYRRKEKKNPVNTQKKLDIIIENAIACKEMYGYDPNHALLYAMQAGTSGWLITDPGYFENKEMSFNRFIKKLNGNAPKKANTINCKECSNIGTCQNADDNLIASCALYTPQREAVAA